MSDMIPQATVDALRQQADISVRLWGIDIELFLPTNFDALDQGNPYVKPGDWKFVKQSSRAFIEWSPNIHKLKRFGVFTEDDLPIIAWFPSQPEVIIGSYIRVPLQYVPATVDTDEFDVTDPLIKSMHDAVALSCYKIVPRRAKRT